jgi:hypothetical protein
MVWVLVFDTGNTLSPFTLALLVVLLLYGRR